MIMETNLGINEKINVRSNMNYKDRRKANELQRSYKIALQHVTDYPSGFVNGGIFLHYAIMPRNTQNHLLANNNFQQAYR